MLYDGGNPKEGSISLPSLGGKRRVHNDGILMLDNHYIMRENQQKCQTLENRLKRLEEEERRAQRNQANAEKKAQEMLLARSRHYNDMMEKVKFYEEKN